MNGEVQRVKAKFAELIRCPLRSFPVSRRRLRETNKRGIYVIYSPRGKVLHVGGTPRGRRGIFQRLRNHLHGQSSFTIKSKYLRKHGGRTLKDRYNYVREHCSYRCGTRGRRNGCLCYSLPQSARPLLLAIGFCGFIALLVVTCLVLTCAP
jgi:hypothetical protein